MLIEQARGEEDLEALQEREGRRMPLLAPFCEPDSCRSTPPLSLRSVPVNVGGNRENFCEAEREERVLEAQ